MSGNPLRILLVIIAFSVTWKSSFAAEDNIVIESLMESYTIIEKGGVPVSVKNSEQSILTALRFDETAIAMTDYGGAVTIDKASAPGAKPIYRQWIDGDIFFEDSRICILEVPVKVGKKVKVEFQRTFTQPEQFDRILLVSNYPVRHYEVEINVPSSLNDMFTVTPYAFPEGAVFEKLEGPGGSVKYKAVIENMAPFHREPQSPSSALISPSLVVTGYFDGIQSLYSYLHGFVEEEEPDDRICTMTQEIIAGRSGDIEKADAIADWVRKNIKYIAIEHGEWAFKPDKAKAVFEKRYGDCKGSANLIKAMLRCASVDGRICWVGTARSIPYDWKDVPALCSGNHCIAAAVLTDTILYLDGTMTYSPPGYIPSSIQGRPVLIEDDDNYLYTRIPVLPPASSSQLLASDLTFSPDKGIIEGTSTIRLTGGEFSSFLSTYHSLNKSKRQGLLDIVVSDGNKAIIVSDAKMHQVADRDSSIVITACVENKSAVSRAENITYIKIGPEQFLMKPVEMEDRKLPVAAGSPHTEKWTGSLKLPDGWKVVSLPDVTLIDNKWFGLVSRHRLDEADNSVESEIVMVMKGGIVPVDEIADFNASLKEMNKNLITWIEVAENGFDKQKYSNGY